MEDINSKFYDYLKKQNAIISEEMEPFKMIKTDYENYIDIESIHRYETVRIRLEPFDIVFLQEKMNKLGE